MKEAIQLRKIVPADGT